MATDEQIAYLSDFRDYRHTPENLREALAAVLAELAELREENRRLQKVLGREQRDCLRQIRERDYAQVRLDCIASMALGEEINWSDHQSKWEEAADEIAKMVRERECYRERTGGTQDVLGVPAIQKDDGIPVEEIERAFHADDCQCPQCAALTELRTLYASQSADAEEAATDWDESPGFVSPTEREHFVELVTRTIVKATAERDKELDVLRELRDAVTKFGSDCHYSMGEASGAWNRIVEPELAKCK